MEVLSVPNSRPRRRYALVAAVAVLILLSLSSYWIYSDSWMSRAQRSDPLTAADFKCDATILVSLNDDRTKTISLLTPPPTLRDLLGIAATSFNLPNNLNFVRVWEKSGVEIRNQRDYVRHLISANSTKSTHLFITVGEERYRPINGAFVYLLTEGKQSLTDWMSNSLRSIEANFNSRFGPYPIIIFYNIQKRDIDTILERVRPVTRIYWVPVHHLFERRLPDLDVFANESLRDDLSVCAGRNWDYGYVQMIRFRAINMWRLPIMQHFDYVLSIDADAEIKSSQVDFFAQAEKSGAYFGYQQCFDDRLCSVGLWDVVNNYIREKKINPYHWSVLPTSAGYYGFFVMFKSSFWRSHKGVADLMDYIDQTGNMIYRRWAEQVFFPIALSLYAPYDKVYHIGGQYELTHYRAVQQQKPRCPGARTQPSCCS